MPDAADPLLAAGRAVRDRVPRREHAAWDPRGRRADPLDILEATAAGRLPELLPLRYGRMVASPFAFMRGAAAVTAADVAICPLTGITVQACGDCHPANFGLFGTPERRLIFDVTDFDETLPASWEFDVKRLAASLVLLARERGYGRRAAREALLALLASYRRRLAEYSGLPPLDVWYARIDAEAVVAAAAGGQRPKIEAFVAAARANTAENLLGTLLDGPAGDRRFREAPPAVRRLPAGDPLGAAFRTALGRYPESLPEERRRLLARYSLADVALKVVGVGSVGTRCGIALHVADGGWPLVLQIKEALPSALAGHAAAEPGAITADDGRRVVVGQRIMQSASDIFLGWTTDDAGRRYYVRQLRDMKKAIPVAFIEGDLLGFFAGLCGWGLARAHARGGEPRVLAGYLGTGEPCDLALADFAEAYADQCEADFERFRKAVRSGRFPADPPGG